MKEYPLDVQELRTLKGYRLTGYYSKGHHGKISFLVAVWNQYSVNGYTINHGSIGKLMRKDR